MQAALNSASLGQRAGRSGLLLTLRAAIGVGVGMLRVALVARPLGPREMGVFALLLLVVEGARALTAFGPRAVLVQRAELPRGYVNTYFVFSVIQGAIIACCVFFSYPILAQGGGRSLLLLHGLVAVSMFVAGCESPGRVLAERDAALGRIAAIETVVIVAELIVTSALAYLLRSALALGIGSLLRSALDVALSYAVFPVRPRLQLDPDARREFMSAGFQFLLMAVGAYITIYGDNAAIGALLGAQALGIYVVAYKLAEIPLTALVAVSKRVLFPVLSRLQRTPVLLRQIVTESLLAQVAVVWPAAVGMYLFADILIPALYGDAFREAIVVLRALVFLTLGRSVANMIVAVLMASGRYDQLTSLKWLEILVFLPTLLVGLELFGLVGAAWGAGLGYVFAGGLRVVAICREQGLTGKDMLRTFGAPSIVVLLAALPASGLRGALHSAQPFLAAALSCVVFGFVYVVGSVSVYGRELRQLYRFFVGQR